MSAPPARQLRAPQPEVSVVFATAPSLDNVSAFFAAHRLTSQQKHRKNRRSSYQRVMIFFLFPVSPPMFAINVATGVVHAAD
jgi:hypothetical protein